MRSTIKRFARNRPWSPHLSVENFSSASENIFNALKKFQKTKDLLKKDYHTNKTLNIMWNELDSALRDNSFILSINNSTYTVPVHLSDALDMSYMFLQITVGKPEYGIHIVEHDIKELLQNKQWFISGLNHELKHCMEYIISKYKIISRKGPPDIELLLNKIPPGVLLREHYPEISLREYVGYINMFSELRANIAQIIHEIQNKKIDKSSLISSSDYISLINSVLKSTLLATHKMPLRIQQNLISLFTKENQKKIIWEVYKALND